MLGNVVVGSHTQMEMHIFTELVGIQMLLMNTLEPMLRGDKIVDAAADRGRVSLAGCHEADERPRGLRCGRRPLAGGFGGVGDPGSPWDF